MDLRSVDNLVDFVRGWRGKRGATAAVHIIAVDRSRRLEAAGGRIPRSLWHERRLGDADPPPASTVKKWMKTRGAIGQRSLESCMPKRGAGPRVKQLHPEVLKLRTDAAIWFWTAREHTVEDAHAEHVRAVTEYNVDRKRRGLAPVRSCCVEWLRVEIKKLQSFQTYSAKFGQAKAHAVYKADGLGRTW